MQSTMMYREINTRTMQHTMNSRKEVEHYAF